MKNKIKKGLGNYLANFCSLIIPFKWFLVGLHNHTFTMFWHKRPKHHPAKDFMKEFPCPMCILVTPKLVYDA